MVLAALLALPACAPAEEEALDGAPTATVEVRNRNWLSVEVSARTRAERHRVGRLAPGRSKVFTLPGRLFRGGAVAMTFELETIGSEGQTLREERTVAPGDHVVLVIPNTR